MSDISLAENICFGFFLQVDPLEFTVLLIAAIVFCFLWKKGTASRGVGGMETPGIRHFSVGDATEGGHGGCLAAYSFAPCGGRLHHPERRRRPHRRAASDNGDSSPFLRTPFSREQSLHRDTTEVHWVLDQFYTGMDDEELDNLSNYSAK